mmetsp:Transcript_32384/g.41606  ORF Transcript_32384/g.41606 Transcript_32384/m.41606 type:complete len:196 (+) Transcript_32384:214-801(+)
MSKEDEKAQKEQQRLEKEAEKARLLAEDEEAVGGIKKSKPKKIKKKDDIGALLSEGLKKAPKTKAEKEAEARKKAKEEARKKQLAEEAAAREKPHDPLAPAPLMENMNHIEPLDGDNLEISASGLDNVMDALSVSSGGGGDSHPEKRRKAAYLTFETEMLPRMREEHPGLKLQQYKQKIFKLWEKSPDNPMNQVA